MSLGVERFEESAWRALRAMRARRSSEPALDSGGEDGYVKAVPRPGSLGRDEVRFAVTEPQSSWRAYQACVENARGAARSRKVERLGRNIFDPQPHAVVISSGPPEMAHVGVRRLAESCRLPLVLDFRDPWSLRERLPEHLASPL